MKKFIFTALLSLSLVAQDQNIFYKDADIKTFAQDIALLTDKTIILDPRVKGVISIYSDAPLDSESIWEVFISTMEVQGYNVLKDGNIYRVIPSQEGVKNFSEDGPLAGSIGSEVIKLRFSSAKDIVNAVKPIVGVRSYIVALQNDREVLIADDADNIKRVRDIIRNLDSELDTSISDFKLKNLSAIEALRLINSLKSDPNTRFDKLAVATFQGSNKLIFSGPLEIVTRAKRVISQLDLDNSLNENTKVIYLNYSQAEDILKILKDVSASFNQEQNIDYKTVITSHEETNSIVIRSNPQTIKTLTSIVEQLDIRRPQVFVEAIIVEISDESAKALGVDTIYSGDATNNTPIALSRFPSTTSPDLLSLAISADDDSNLGANTSAASSLLSTRGLVAGVGNIIDGEDNFAMLLSVLKDDSNSNILSTPSAVVMDNEEASLLVGQEIPVTTGESLGTNNLTPFRTTAREEIGIKLEVKPQINEADSVALFIRQEVSSIAGSQLPNSSDLITNKREIETTVLADNGEILVLGGLISEDIQESVNKVPLLGDLPIIGALFRSSAKSVEQRNLMIFLRPTILRDSITTKDLSEEKFNLIRAKQLLKEEESSN
ncbi:MAG: type II secretion system secretin GspD [Pseudomonadota bacterium]|jgi:general secretion pathway protein D|nr:type II secretion system secretin GspD [Pseudomonadota bacterium]|tara:strand:- start:803 stop:2620 length:1818 start_codon:yes stop_codon:yes gene_type:complete